MIELKNISKYYAQDNNVSLGIRKVSVKCKKNEFVAITGESGSGKTTFLNVISGIDTYEEGELYLNGEETSGYTPEDFDNYRKENIGFIFQNYNLIDSYTVLQNIEIPLILKGVPKKERLEKAKEIIEKVGLSKRIHHRGTKLSGGEKQRVVIARALASNAKILVCDEPTGNLDSETGRQIIELLKEVSKDRLVLIVTHNFEQVEKYCTRKLRFFDGELVEDIVLKDIQDEKKEEKKKEAYKIQKKYLLSKIAVWCSLKNLINTPKRTLLSFFIFTSSIFVFMIMIVNIAGSYYSAVDISNINLTEDRVIIKNRDNSLLSNEYIDTLRSNPNVKFVETLDMINDANFSAIIERLNFNIGFYGFRDYRSMSDDLKVILGRKPEKENEVMINSNDVAFKYRNFKDFLNLTMDITSGKDKLPIRIVGFYKGSASNNSCLYGTVELKKYIVDLYYRNSQNYFYLENNKEISNIRIRYLNTIEKPTLYIPEINTSREYQAFYQDPFRKINLSAEIVSSDDEYINLVLPNEYINTLLTDTYQVSVYLKNTYNAPEKVQNLQKEGIYLLHTSLFDHTDEDALGIVKNLMLVFLSFIVLGVITIFTSYIIFLVLNNKNKDYTILRSLGANKRTISRIILFENLLLCTIGNLLLMTLCGIIGKIYQITIFEPFYRFDFITILICILGSLFFAYYISRRYNKSIFKHSVNHNLKKEE